MQLQSISGKETFLLKRDIQFFTDKALAQKDMGINVHYQKNKRTIALSLEVSISTITSKISSQILACLFAV
jgi:hypothetical protein